MVEYSRFELYAVVLLIFVSKTLCACPEICTCTEDDLNVVCSNLNLTVLPYLDHNITSLNISHNAFSEFSEYTVFH